MILENCLANLPPLNKREFYVFTLNVGCIQRNTALLNRVRRWRIVYSLFDLLTANADLDLALGLC